MEKNCTNIRIEKNEKVLKVLENANQQIDEIEEEIEEEEYEFSDRKYTVGDMIKMKIPFSAVFQMKGISFGFSWQQVIQLLNNRRVKGKKISINTTIGTILKTFSVMSGNSFL
jgi:hypothetical protein